MNPINEPVAAEPAAPAAAIEPETAPSSRTEELGAADEAIRSYGMDNAEAAAMAPIQAIDPAFQSFADLAAMPEAETFKSLVLKGNTLADAFRLARYELLNARRAAEAGKSALSRAYNRTHLAATGGGGAAADLVPPETMEMYRQICPGLTDEAYRAHYKRTRAT